MDTLIHADVFFFVTTIAVVVIAVVFAAILIYAAILLRRAKKIIQNVQDITREIKEEAVLVRADIRSARAKVVTGLKFKHAIDFISNIANRFTGFGGKKGPKSRSK